MIEDLMDRTVKFKRTTTVTRDEIGSVLVVAEQTTTTRGYLEPRTSTETLPDRETQISEYLLVVPAGADVDGWDRAEIDGITYDVFGPPRHFHNPRLGHEAQVEMTLRLVT